MKKIARSVSVLLLTVLAFVPFEPAYATSVLVAIKQLNPSGATQQTTCADAQRNCALPLTIDAGLPTAQSLNVQVRDIPGGLVLMFKTGSGYYYAGDTVNKNGFYYTMWSKPLSGGSPAVYDVTLVQPLVQDLLKVPAINIKSDNTAHPSVAKLEITVTPGP